MDGIQRIRIRMDTRSVKINTEDSVTAEDLKMAENAIISYVQRPTFSEEISNLQDGRSNVKRESSIYRLVLDEGVLRVGGRLRRTSMPEERKPPAIH